MYQPQHFRNSDLPSLHTLMHRNPLATLVTQANGLDANHIPLLLRADGAPYGRLAGHIARANPLAQQAAVDGGIECLVIFQEADHYISPAWYAEKAISGKVVPTWNYSVVHAHGRLRVMNDDACLLALLQELTNSHESQMPQPWQVSDAPTDYLQKMLRAIVGIEIEITELQGKNKLSQNKSLQDQQAMRAGLQQIGTAAALQMAESMAAISAENLPSPD